MPIIRVVAIGVAQADINAEVDPVILRVPPAGVNDLVCIGGGVDGTIGNAIIQAVVTIVIDPVTEAIGPVSARACIAYARLGRRCARRRRRRTVLARLIAGVGKDNIILSVIGGGMIEDGFLRGSAGVGRIEKWRNGCLQRERTFRRGAAHTEEKAAEQEGCQCILE